MGWPRKVEVMPAAVEAMMVWSRGKSRDDISLFVVVSYTQQELEMYVGNTRRYSSIHVYLYDRIVSE